jgi:diguanylate cyclase (GGDEF)-like protein
MKWSGLDTRGAVPYRVLSLILVLVATASAVLGLETDVTWLRNLDLIVAGALLVLAALLVTVGPRIHDGLALDAVLLLMVILSACVASVVPNADGQVLIGLGLVLLAVFAAAFRPPVGYAIILIVAIAGYSAATVVNSFESVRLVLFVVDGIVIGTSLMIHLLIQRQHRTLLVDPLTGVYNRRALEALAPAIAGAAERSGVPVSVGVVDIDNFKSFNDTYGHRAGDNLLIEVAKSWREASRRSDLVVRSGGDEFVIVLVGVKPGKATSVAERIPEPASGSWSVGFSLWDPQEDIYEAIMRADHVMYRHKASR